MFPGLDEAELLLAGWQHTSAAFLAVRSTGSAVGWGVGPGIGSLAQHPGLVIVSNKPPHPGGMLLGAGGGACDCLRCPSKLDIYSEWFLDYMYGHIYGTSTRANAWSGVH